MNGIFKETIWKLLILIFIIWLSIFIFTKIYTNIRKKQIEEEITQELTMYIKDNNINKNTFLFHAEGI